jgi:hypothetical protein
MSQHKSSTGKSNNKLTTAASAALLLLALSACGGGGSGGSGNGAATSALPYINAAIVTLQTTGTNSAAAVAVRNNDANGSTISDANVVINGSTATYSADTAFYSSSLNLPAGARVSVSITVNGRTYTAEGTRALGFPALTNPASGGTWNANNPNNVTWTGAAGSSSSGYLLEILDVNGGVAWPLPERTFKSVSAATNSYLIEAGSLFAETYTVLLGETKLQTFTNAASGSSLAVVAFDNRTFTVTNSVARQLATTRPAAVSTLIQTMPNSESLSMRTAQTVLKVPPSLHP